MTKHTTLVAFVLGLVSSAMGAWPMAEISFRISQLEGNPFDYRQNDVMAVIVGPDGKSFVLPAFYDGEDLWRVRCTPRIVGRYVLRSITRNGTRQEISDLQNSSFEATGPAGRGFIHIDKQHPMRFAYDDGTVYYPVGFNIAWSAPQVQRYVTEMLARAGAAGANWSRVWMNYWDDKCLNWNARGETLEPGMLRLDVARTWDEIVRIAEAGGVGIQMTLQHHGQFSTGANPNWQDHPWNVARGGWLEKPEQFFSDPVAIGLTKAKYRYVIARWGYSPSIMAWELFNEVEYTDAGKNAKEAIAAWHGEMAAFLREQDPYRHLVTTSCMVDDEAVVSAIDFIQPHAYPEDLYAAIAAMDLRKHNKPYFYGEFGPPGSGWQQDIGYTLHRMLWTSLMSGASGAAQYWYWDTIDPHRLHFHYTSAQSFIRESGLLEEPDMRPVTAHVQTRELGPMRFGPGADWVAKGDGPITISRDGAIGGIEAFGSFLHGQAHPEIRKPLEFDVDFQQAGTLSFRFGDVYKTGARVSIYLDERLVTVLNFSPENKPEIHGVRTFAAVEIPVPAGRHLVRLENTGSDWVQIKEVELNPYGPLVAAHAKSNGKAAVLWLRARDEQRLRGDESGQLDPIATEVSLAMQEGLYSVTWWDTRAGRAMRSQTVRAEAGRLRLEAPELHRDIAAFVKRSD